MEHPGGTHIARDRPRPYADAAHGYGQDHPDDHDHGAHQAAGPDSQPSHEHGGGILSRVRHAFAHTHAAHERVDSALETSDRGIWALKVSLLGLGLTGLIQVVIVWFSGSVALLADTIHNFADAGTSIPLWIAFALVKRGTTRRFTYGYGRAEDVAGFVIVLVIFISACVAGYESIMKLLNPRPVEHLGWVAAAAVVGFMGNEAVAILRIGVGREIGSAALVADGLHSRVDGFTSLAVLVGVLGVALGAPVLDPLVGLGITIAILFIVKDAAASIWRRLMDGIEPEILAALEHAPRHVPGVLDVGQARARWVGHRVVADLSIRVSPEMSVSEAAEVARRVEASLGAHVPAFGTAHVKIEPFRGAAGEPHLGDKTP